MVSNRVPRGEGKRANGQAANPLTSNEFRLMYPEGNFWRQYRCERNFSVGTVARAMMHEGRQFRKVVDVKRNAQSHKRFSLMGLQIAVVVSTVWQVGEFFVDFVLDDW